MEKPFATAHSAAFLGQKARIVPTSVAKIIAADTKGLDRVIGMCITGPLLLVQG